MDRLEAMSLFVAAIEAGSLSAAGRRFGIPLATVSRKVSDLERHLKTRLLNRSTRQLTLTDAGHAYLAACRRILDEVGEAERTAAGEYSTPTGELIITAPIVFGRLHVLPVVTGFLGAYPDVAIRLMLADRITQLTEEHIDLAVRIGELPDSSLVATRVGSIRRVVCASPAYLAKHGTPDTPRDLVAHSCITFEGLTAPAAWTFAAGKTELAVPIRSRLRVNTAEAAIDAAIAGVGMTRVLSYQITAAVRSGTLCAVLEAFEPQPWPVSLVHVRQGLLPVKLRAFLDFAAPRLKKRLAQATWQA
ncbi:LysR family transcriptional regulator [Mesorhizobium sp.]|uniref:LysR family transcriptional regulator n=1 Tax=Mesorhizobium sp. TaxID=1871066 RepID=UPI001225E5FF|nr:LysR family transcriptional regulator [Mesorhizobium sp.]TIO06324.1 MAG: LysR family transcriptional regulator [Mesorhizobium sp.]TIO30778.1 MAG: LysR family transcriptional regulator [Mesorhizobium sp.]TIP09942.1 MAG: LysR family transcriptional regulator [Mesorhizobium sp.]